MQALFLVQIPDNRLTNGLHSLTNLAKKKKKKNVSVINRRHPCLPGTRLMVETR